MQNSLVYKCNEKIRDVDSTTSKDPIRMTVEELREEVMQLVEDVKNGRGIKHEDFIKEMKSWM